MQVSFFFLFSNFIQRNSFRQNEWMSVCLTFFHSSYAGVSSFLQPPIHCRALRHAQRRRWHRVQPLCNHRRHNRRRGLLLRIRPEGRRIRNAMKRSLGFWLGGGGGATRGNRSQSYMIKCCRNWGSGCSTRKRQFYFIF